MKLQAKSSREFNAALQKSARCIASKNTIAILDNVLLSQHEDGNLFLTSASTEARLTIPAPISIVSGTFKNVVLPIKYIMPFLSTLPDCTVSFTFDDDHTLTLEYCTGDGDKVKAGKASLTWLDAIDYPQMTAPSEDAVHISLPMQMFNGILDTSANFVGRDEIRPVLSCLCIDIAEDMSEVYFVGTDGHALFKSILGNDPKNGGTDFFRGGTPEKILVHMSFFRPFAAFAGCENIDIESDNHTIRFSSGDIEYLCKAIEGRYPNYNSVIPRNNPYFITFDKKEMLAVVKRVCLFSPESDNSIVLKKEGMFLNVSANNIDFSLAADDQVTIADSQCEDDFRIGFNALRLQDAINAIPGNTIRMQLSHPSKAAVLTADEPSPSVLTLVMPVLIND